MNIYSPAGALLCSIEVDDNSYRYRSIMAEETLVLYFSTVAERDFPIGSYSDFNGSRYTLLTAPDVKQVHSRHYDYTLTFSGASSRIKTWKFRNPVDHRLKFSLTAKPREHLQMLVDNLNARDNTGGGWSVGECLVDVEKLINYDHDSCLDALTRMADEFKTEYEFTGKVVSLHKVEYNKSTPLALSYGKGNGFVSGVGRLTDGQSFAIGRLYVQGGDRNIDRSKYPADETLRASSNGCLILPPDQTISYDGEHFEDEEGYNATNAKSYKVDSLGLSITENKTVASDVAEDSLDRSDDYPKRVGRVTWMQEVSADKNLFDFADNTIPDELNYGDYIIEGEKMSVIFQSGMLAGREFEVKYIHDEQGEKPGRRFEIVPEEIDGVMMPGGVFVPRAADDNYAGDEYAVFGCMLPDAYIRNDADKSGASWDMFRNAVKYLYDNSDEKLIFSGELDGIYAKQHWDEIKDKIRLGGFVAFSDLQLTQGTTTSVRITGIREYINRPHFPKLELSNEQITGTVSSTLKTLEAANEIAIKETRDEVKRFSKRRFRDAMETMEAINASLLEGFTPHIDPLTVSTMDMLVGSPQLQFIFSYTRSGDPVVPDFYWDAADERFHVPTRAVFLKHMTIGIKDIKAKHSDDEYKSWRMRTHTFTPEDTAVVDKPYYLYAQCGKEATIAEYALTLTPMVFETDTAYNCLIGILNARIDNQRSFVTLFGFTEVLPGRITTERIVSTDGRTFFDLARGEIGGNIKFVQTNAEGDIVTDADGNPLYQGLSSYVSDSINAYNATLINGNYIRTGLINAAELIVQRVRAGADGGKQIIIEPSTESIEVHDDTGATVMVVEGNEYSDPVHQLFGDSSGDIKFDEPNGVFEMSLEGTTGSKVIASKTTNNTPWKTDTPTEVLLSGYISASVKALKNPTFNNTTLGTTGQSLVLTQLSYVSMTVTLYAETFFDEAMTQLIESKTVACVGAYADGYPLASGEYKLADRKEIVMNAQKVFLPAGYHRFRVAEAHTQEGGGSWNGAWGYKEGVTNSRTFSASYHSSFYLSRFFARGFLLGTRNDNYILARQSSNDTMELMIETAGQGFCVNSEGVHYRRNGGEWKTLT